MCSNYKFNNLRVLHQNASATLVKLKQVNFRVKKCLTLSVLTSKC